MKVILKKGWQEAYLARRRKVAKRFYERAQRPGYVSHLK